MPSVIRGDDNFDSAVGGIQRVTLPNIPITSTGGLQLATGIPTNAVRIIIMFENVGGNTTNGVLIQAQVGGVTQGSSNTYQSASYSGGSPTGSTQGYIIGRKGNEDKMAGIMVLEKMYGNTWAESHAVHMDAGPSPAASAASGGGVGSFSGPIDGLWLGGAGSLTYSGGSITVAYETA